MMRRKDMERERVRRPTRHGAGAVEVDLPGSKRSVTIHNRSVSRFQGACARNQNPEGGASEPEPEPVQGDMQYSSYAQVLPLRLWVSNPNRFCVGSTCVSSAATDFLPAATPNQTTQTTLHVGNPLGFERLHRISCRRRVRMVKLQPKC